MLLPAVLMLACQTPCSGQAMSTLVSAFPYGEQLSMDLTPDGSLAFVAEGAAITFLNMPPSPWTASPTVIEKFPVPEMQPLALKYFHKAGLQQQDWLFIAGGTHGLWAIPVCSSMIMNHVACGGYSPIHVDSIEGGFFERKRCLALAVDEHSTATGGAVLLALLAASSDPQESSIGRTELRAYAITGSAFPLLATLEIPVATISPQRSQRGTALARDPADHASVFVAMGKGGIWRAVLTGGGPYFLTTTSPFWLPANIDSVRDLSIVRATVGGTSKALLYAALNYGKVLEYDLTSNQSATIPINTCGYPARIAATASGTQAFVAIATETDNGKSTDVSAPYSVNGLWSDICLSVGVDDPDDPLLAPPGCPRKVIAYKVDLTQFPALAQSQVLVQDMTTPSASMWSTLWFPNTFTGGLLPLYENSGHYGTQIRTYNTASWTATANTPYIGKGLGATDATPSGINTGVVRFGLENAGAVIFDGYLAYIDPVSPYGITIIPNSQHECPNGFPSPPCCGAASNAGAFGGNIMGEARWRDMGTPTREWYLPGRSGKSRFNDSNPAVNCPGCSGPAPTCNNCPIVQDCGTAPWDPCDHSGGPSDGYYLPNTHWRPADPAGYPGDRGVWQLIAHTLPPSGMPSGGGAIAPRWEQIILPKIAQTTGHYPDEVRASTLGYNSSVVDPRFTASGYPRAVYAVRNGTNYGLHVFKPEELTNQAQQSQGVGGCTATPWTGGYGEMFNDTAVAHWQVFTRIELERDNQHGLQCVTNSPCQGGARFFLANRAEIYQTRDQSGATAYILAVASGFPTCTTPQTNPCYWTGYYGRSMIVLYDITHTGDGTFAAPVLVRVGFGLNQGNAFAVKTKTYGSGSTARTYAFVADVTGSVVVFDVTGDKIFPAPASNKTYLPATPVLGQAASFAFPKDPHDGLRTNCIDLELDGVYLYCALGRGGLGIVDVSDPLHPVLCSVLDTPGLAEGVAIRWAGITNPHRQLIVSDSRCGVRVYE